MPAFLAFLPALMRGVVPFLIGSFITKIITGFGIFFFTYSFVGGMIDRYTEKFFTTLSNGNGGATVSDFMILAHLFGIDKFISILLGSVTAVIAIKSLKTVVGMR